jgi:ABC-type phosphate transport system substrate-binding protein
MPRSGSFFLGVLAPVLALVALVSGCEGILGLGDYSIGGSDGGQDGSDSAPPVDSTAPPADSAMDSGRADGDAADSGAVTDTGTAQDSGDACNGDGSCYACTPTTTTEFLNACTSSVCVPFDDSMRISGFDGGFPPITPPVVDAGVPDTAAPPDAAMTDAGMGADTAPPPPACPLTNVVYVTGSSAIQPLIAALAQQLAMTDPAISIVYQKPGSCVGVDDIINPPGPGITGGSAISWSGTSDPGTACTITQAQANVDIGVSDVFAESCPGIQQLPGGVFDFTGPIQTETFIVPNTSSQTAISASAAYFVWGLGADSGVAPWETNARLFRRNANSGTQVMIANGINVLPAGDWRGVDANGSLGVLMNVSSPPDPNSAEETLGIVALTDVSNAFLLQIKVLAYKHYDQDCAYTPSSTATARDLRNVRDGHYALWGPLHLLTHVDNNNVPLNPSAKEVIAYLTGIQTPPGGLDLIQLEALNNVLPSCAMQVTRTTEVGPLMSFAPPGACGCAYDAVATGVTTCKPCQTSIQCTQPGAQTCSHGYCEAQ